MHLSCSARRLARVVLCVVLAIAAERVDAQGRGAAPSPVQPTPPRDAGSVTSPAAPVGTASIVGTVVTTTGQPARRARVNLSGGESRGRSTTTDDQGRYSFGNLPAGRYSVSASKPGHVTVTYGQHRPGAGRPGTPIELADGQRFEAKLQLPRGGVITGTVLDEQGEPTPGTQVRVLRYVLQNGMRSTQGAGSGATDDRGSYRVYGLQPGEYAVCATPRPGSIATEFERIQSEVSALREAAARVGPEQAQAMIDRAAAVAAQLGAQEEQGTGYAPVCYPGTTSAAGAVAVPLGVGEERSGIDFQLQLVPVARIEGVVINTAGPPPQGVQVTLVAAGQEFGVDTRSARPDANGRFRITNVPPGQYTLIARGTLGGERPVGPAAGAPPAPRAVSPAVRLWAMTDVSVDGRNLSDVVLMLQHGMSVSGHVAFEGTTLPPPTDLTRVRINMTPMGGRVADAQLGSPAAVSADASGRFTVQGVPPGRYRFSVSSGSGGWYLESAIAGGQDALDFPLEVKPGQNGGGVVVTLTDRQTEIGGTITNDRNEPASAYTILVYPSDPRYWVPQSRRIQTTRPATDGRFTLRNLPAGEYRIAAIVDPEPGSWYDPAFLQQLDAASLRVVLAAGEKKVQNLRMSSAR